MRLFTTIVFALVFLLCAAFSSVVSAQTNPSEACLACAVNNMVKASPNCDEDILPPSSNVAQWTPKQKSCICPLTTSGAWLTSCGGTSGGCTAEFIKQVQDEIADPAVKTACAGSGGTAGASTGTALSSNKALSGAALAVVSAAIMFS
ncbi:hypothetical protein BGZ47_004368 [Haplosporangium gracile]|nr:hypothetical protein BGZ47_004368 [Haplosporangium gracile]